MKHFKLTRHIRELARRGWLPVALGMALGIGVDAASLAISCHGQPNLYLAETWPSSGADPFERARLRGAPFPWLQSAPAYDRDNSGPRIRWARFTANLILWAGLGGVVIGEGYRRSKLRQSGTRYPDDTGHGVQTSLVARGFLSLGATLFGWLVLSIPWLVLWGTRTEHVRLSLPLGILVWFACVLPLVALVDEQSEMFSTRRFPRTVALLAFVSVSLLAIRMRSDFPVSLVPKAVGAGLVAGWAYAIGLPRLRMRAARSIASSKIESVSWGEERTTVASRPTGIATSARAVATRRVPGRGGAKNLRQVPTETDMP